MTKKTNNDIKRSSIKSIIFSGLLAFSFMGIDNAFCENNANKAVCNILEYYQKWDYKSLIKYIKANISIILDTKIEGESLFDLLVRCQENNISLSKLGKTQALFEAFADTKYQICWGSGATPSTRGSVSVSFHLDRKNISNKRNINHAIRIYTKSISEDPYMANGVGVRIEHFKGFFDGIDTACLFDCVVKKENGKYMLFGR